MSASTRRPGPATDDLCVLDGACAGQLLTVTVVTHQRWLSAHARERMCHTRRLCCRRYPRTVRESLPQASWLPDEHRHDSRTTRRVGPENSVFDGDPRRRGACWHTVRVPIPAPELQRFEDETAFERYAISSYVFTDPDSAGQFISADLRNPTGNVNVAVNLVESVSSGSVLAAVAPFRPLIFGASYKILDLLVELTLRVHLGASAPAYMTFAEKMKRSGIGVPPVPPLDTVPSLWAALVALYRHWEEVRHSLVHRTATVDVSTWALTGYDRGGTPLTPISAGEQEAFARFANGAASAVLARAVGDRDALYLGWWSNRLAGHHWQTGEPEANPDQLVPRVVFDLDPQGANVWRLERDVLIARAQKVFADVTLTRSYTPARVASCVASTRSRHPYLTLTSRVFRCGYGRCPHSVFRSEAALALELNLQTPRVGQFGGPWLHQIGSASTFSKARSVVRQYRHAG